MYKQEPPFCVQIELVQGCNLRCAFCGTAGLEKTPHYMEDRVMEATFTQLHALGWNPRVEFAMHGEPTMHPRLAEILQVMYDHNHYPHLQTMMLTNGFRALENYKILRRFIDVLAVDVYEHDNKGRLFTQWARDYGYRVFDYPSRYYGASPHERWHASELPAIVAVQDITKATTGTHATLNNHCGAGGRPRRSPLMQRCAKPFRELAIRWDGSVALCCNDFRGIFKLGNVLEEGIEAIWQGERLNAARHFLYHEQRIFKPCCWCDAKSYRTGLLPDKKGKDTLPKPDDMDLQLVGKTVYGEPYSVPRPRVWELPENPTWGKLCV